MALYSYILWCNNYSGSIVGRLQIVHCILRRVNNFQTLSKHELSTAYLVDRYSGSVEVFSELKACRLEVNTELANPFTYYTVIYYSIWYMRLRLLY